MVIFLYGPDNLRRIRKKQELIKAFLKKRSDLGLKYFDLSNDNVVIDIKDFLLNQSIFESSKLGILDGDLSYKFSDLESSLKEVKESKKITIIISSSKKPTKGFSFLSRKPVLAQSFNYLKGAEWKKFISKEAIRAKIKLTPSAISYLASIYEGDTWRLVTELEKVSCLSGGEIDRSDLDNLSIEGKSDLWNLIGSLRDEKTENRLKSLEIIFNSGEALAKVFNLLSFQISSYDIGYRSGPDVKKTAKMDLAVKSGKLEYDEALINLII